MARLPALLLMAFVMANTALANDIGPFIGKWSVNTEETFQALKASPEYNPETAETDRKMLDRFYRAMQLELSDTSITYIRGKRSQVIPYNIVSTAPSAFVAEVLSNGSTFTLSFSLREGKFLNMKSTGSDDMNMYVWEKSTMATEVDSELKVMTDITTELISNK